MNIGAVLGIIVSTVILVGLLVTALWPDEPEWEFKLPWIPPRSLTEDDREWVEEQLRMAKEED